MLVIKAEIQEGMTDQQLRDAVRPMPNGEYATDICRSCGCFLVSSTGYVNTAKIHDTCSDCPGLMGNPE